MTDEKRGPTDDFEGFSLSFLATLSLFVGLSMLLPWNSFLKSLPYLKSRLPAALAEKAPLYLTLSFTITNSTILTLFTLTDADRWIITKLFAKNRTMTPMKLITYRMIPGLILGFIVVLLGSLAPLKDLLGDSGRLREPQPALFGYFLLLFVMSAVMVTLMQRSVYPLMTLLPVPTKLIPAMLTGQALAGIGASAGSFALAGKSDSGSLTSVIATFVYFMVSAVILAVTLTMYCIFLMSSSAKRKQRDQENGTKSEEILSTSTVSERKSSTFSEIRATFWQIQPWPAALCFNFMLTLSIFPGLLSSTGKAMSPSDSFATIYFLPLTFLLFDGSDLVGKSMPSWYPRWLAPGHEKLWARLLPYMRSPLWLVFLTLPQVNRAIAMKVSFVVPDWIYFGAVIILGLTSGWGNAICLINSPLALNHRMTAAGENPANSGFKSDRVGSIMGLSITLGLLLGSLMSFATRAVACQCNPFA